MRGPHERFPRFKKINVPPPAFCVGKYFFVHQCYASVFRSPSLKLLSSISCRLLESTAASLHQRSHLCIMTRRITNAFGSLLSHFQEAILADALLGRADDVGRQLGPRRKLSIDETIFRTTSCLCSFLIQRPRSIQGVPHCYLALVGLGQYPLPFYA